LRVGSAVHFSDQGLMSRFTLTTTNLVG
jgi:hypothetical protein